MCELDVIVHCRTLPLRPRLKRKENVISRCYQGDGQRDKRKTKKENTNEEKMFPNMLCRRSMSILSVYDFGIALLMNDFRSSNSLGVVS